jgi:hypothetical protein
VAQADRHRRGRGRGARRRVGIGRASNSQQSQLNAANAMIARDRTTISQLQGTAASLRDQIGSTDTSNIIDNNNITGPATVDLSGAYAFDISGGCSWVKIG